jgi:hypothetical protein
VGARGVPNAEADSDTCGENEEMHRPGIATRKMIRIARSNKNMERQELMGCLGR